MDREQTAIEPLKTALEMSLAEYSLPFAVTMSSGKDISVYAALAERAGYRLRFHNHATADALETVYFVREEFCRLEQKGLKCVVNYPSIRESARPCGS